MAGTYTEGISKILSGVYTLIKAAIASVTKGDRGVIGYPFTSDWGPVNKLVLTVGGSDFKTMYNADKSALSVSKIWKHAFKGNPQKIIGYRMATGAATNGTVILNDTGAAKSLEIETLYPSARAFQAIVAAGTSGGKVVQIIENGVEVFKGEGTDVATLEKLINASGMFKVKSKGANLPANNAGVAFTGGNNGEIVTATEYAAFLDAMEADRRANAFALDGVTDEAIIATADAWVRRVRLEGFYTTFVRGGLATWDSDIALGTAKSIAANYRGIVVVGNGCDGYTAADMAIFIAARVGSVALNRTLTDETVPYTAVNVKLKPGQRETAKTKGLLVFVQDGDFVEVDEGINSLTNPTIDGETAEMGKIRVNNALDYIAGDLERFGKEYKKTKSNTQEAREIYASLVETTYYRGLERLEVLGEGSTCEPDPDYHGKNNVFTPKLDEAFFLHSITVKDSMEKIYNKIGVNFKA